MKAQRVKEATSYDTNDSLSKTLEVFDKIDLGDSDS